MLSASIRKLFSLKYLQKLIFLSGNCRQEVWSGMLDSHRVSKGRSLFTSERNSFICTKQKLKCVWLNCFRWKQHFFVAHILKIFYTEVFPQYFKKVKTKSFLFSEKLANIDISVWHLPPRYSISKWYSSHSYSIIRANFKSYVVWSKKLLTVKAELFCGSEFEDFPLEMKESPFLQNFRTDKIKSFMRLDVCNNRMCDSVDVMHVNEIVPTIMYWQDDKRGPTNVKK